MRFVLGSSRLYSDLHAWIQKPFMRFLIKRLRASRRDEA
jgi:hypothetical protein